MMDAGEVPGPLLLELLTALLGCLAESGDLILHRLRDLRAGCLPSAVQKEVDGPFSWRSSGPGLCGLPRWTFQRFTFR
jgi:hypothetical protein